jgi:hypothetical protein
MLANCAEPFVFRSVASMWLKGDCSARDWPDLREVAGSAYVSIISPNGHFCR